MLGRGAGGVGEADGERPPGLRDNEPLAEHTTLELGGPAAYFCEVSDREALRAALRWARRRGLEVAILGGGSNLVVADTGFDGLVVKLALAGIERRDLGGRYRLVAAAGEPWDRVVALAVGERLAGIECLSGIPGSAGATPIQNVGAYGQEVGDVLRAVEVLDLEGLETRWVPAERCGLGYRTSCFRRAPGRWVVLALELELEPGGRPTLRYPELERLTGPASSLAETRAAVLELRRSKGMLLEPGTANRRSAGSFFVNPVLAEAVADEVAARACRLGLVADLSQVPRYPVAAGTVKLSAAWLIERAGFARGLRRGAVGVSPHHALALVHHGGGSSAELLALAGEIRRRVAERFGVTLEPEPVFVGFTEGDPLSAG